MDRFEESERLFLDVDRRDLAVSMRKKLGDWFRVLQLLKGSAGGLGNDKETEEAWNNIGRHHAERHEWSEAVTYYEKARNTERLIQVCSLTHHIFLGLFSLKMSHTVLDLPLASYNNRHSPIKTKTLLVVESKLKSIALVNRQWPGFSATTPWRTTQA